MKKTTRVMILMAMVSVVTILLAVSVRVKAKEDQRRNYDRKIGRFMYGIEDELEDSEEYKKYVKEYELDYKDLGSGVYEVSVTFNMRGINTVEAHAIYDAESEEMEYDYYLINGRRCDRSWLEKIYPGF